MVVAQAVSRDVERAPTAACYDVHNLARPGDRTGVACNAKRHVSKPPHALLGRYDRLQWVQHAARDATVPERRQRIWSAGTTGVQRGASPHARCRKGCSDWFDAP